jgi:GxxExxY protein
MTENELGDIIVSSAIAIHKDLGPGLFESVYEAILSLVLSQQGLSVVRQVTIPINYKGNHFDEGFRADMIVNGKVIIELKSIEKMANVHKKQLLTYLRLSDLKIGYLLNFGQELMKDGIVRIINGKL